MIGADTMRQPGLVNHWPPQVVANQNPRPWARREGLGRTIADGKDALHIGTRGGVFI